MQKPEEGETRGQFSARCMIDPEVLASHPEAADRFAFCNSTFEQGRPKADPKAIAKEDGLKESQAYVVNSEGLREAVNPLTDEERKELVLLSGANTAKARDKASAPMRYYEEAGLLQGSVLDFGCGKDVHDFARYDPTHYPETAPLNEAYDTVTCNYVLNVLPLEGLRANVMLSLRALVKPGGVALVSVWQRSPDADTFKTSKGYQCGWSKEEWSAFMGKFWEVEALKSPGGVWSWKLTHRAPEPAPLQESVHVGPREAGGEEFLAGAAKLARLGACWPQGRVGVE